MVHGTNVIPFPTPVHRLVDQAAIRAVRCLAEADLVSEREAVRTLRSLGAVAEEVELVRAFFALRRRRI